MSAFADSGDDDTGDDDAWVEPTDRHDEWLEATMHLYAEMEMYTLEQPAHALVASPRWLAAAGRAARGLHQVIICGPPRGRCAGGLTGPAPRGR